MLCTVLLPATPFFVSNDRTTWHVTVAVGAIHCNALVSDVDGVAPVVREIATRGCAVVLR